MSTIISILQNVWSSLFSVIEPHLGISFGALYLGIFVVAISLRVLMPLLGIAGGTVKGISRKHKENIRLNERKNANRPARRKGD